MTSGTQRAVIGKSHGRREYSMREKRWTYRWWLEQGGIGKRIVFVRPVMFVWLV